MGVNFFQNGVSLGSGAGWGGYTGSNNYVVRYDLTTGSAGASAVSVALSGIYYGSNAGTQSFGFKISTSAAAFANARNIAPDSTPGRMSYMGANGYCCTLTADGLNLSPNTVYYIFVYVATAGAEYYSGWNCTAPLITLSGSYSRPRSTISSLSPQVNTGGAVSLIMNRAGDCWHKASFIYGGKTLAVSEAFAASLSYTCPRAWMENDTTALSLPVTVSVQSYADASCTDAAGEPDTAGFILTADAGMRPVLDEGAVLAQVLNTGAASGFTEFIAGVSRARVSFDMSKISLAACAGATVNGYTLRYKGRTVTGQSSPVDTGVLPSDCTLTCAVTDSRGREGSVSAAVTMLPYVPPSLSGITAVRCTAAGVPDESGEYYRLKAALNFTPLNSKNSASVSVSIRPTGGEWSADTELTGFESGVWSNEWAAPAVLGGGLTGDSYTLRLTVTDAVGSRSEYTLRFYHQQWAMKFNADGTALGFGMAPTAANAVQMPDAWRLYVGMLVLSENSYGTALPGEAVSEPVEGQLYFYLTDA